MVSKRFSKFPPIWILNQFEKMPSSKIRDLFDTTKMVGVERIANNIEEGTFADVDGNLSDWIIFE